MLLIALALVTLLTAALGSHIAPASSLECLKCTFEANNCLQTNWTSSSSVFLQPNPDDVRPIVGIFPFNGTSVVMWGTLLGGEVSIVVDGISQPVHKVACGALVNVTGLDTTQTHNVVIAIGNMDQGVGEGILVAGFTIDDEDDTSSAESPTPSSSSSFFSVPTATAEPDNSSSRSKSHVTAIAIPCAIGGALVLATVAIVIVMRRRAGQRVPPSSRVRQFAATQGWPKYEGTPIELTDSKKAYALNGV